MIHEFVNRFIEMKNDIAAQFAEKHPDGYIDIVRIVVGAIQWNAEESINPNRIHEIDDGSCQGTLVYVIGSKQFQPDDYWYVKVFYGSCSACDTLEGILRYSDPAGKPTQQQVDDYMTLALHIVQGLRKMNGETVQR